MDRLINSYLKFNSIDYLTNILHQTGLFHKAILMGAYGFVPLATFRESNALYGLKMAENLGFEGNANDRKELLSFLKKQEAKLLVERQRKFIKQFQKVYNLFFLVKLSTYMKS